MTEENFWKLQSELFTACKELVEKKNKDYSDKNREFLSFFYEEAAAHGITPLQLLSIMMTKHLNAIKSYCKSGGQNESEPIEGRIMDSINYHTFMLALIEDKKAENTPNIRLSYIDSVKNYPAFISGNDIAICASFKLNVKHVLEAVFTDRKGVSYKVEGLSEAKEMLTNGNWVYPVSGLRHL